MGEIEISNYQFPIKIQISNDENKLVNDFKLDIWELDILLEIRY